jgi:hypothetical protein
MAERVAPMIHVPDVRSAARWYETIGFKTVRTKSVTCTDSGLRSGSRTSRRSEQTKPRRSTQCWMSYGARSRSGPRIRGRSEARGPTRPPSLGRAQAHLVSSGRDGIARDDTAAQARG